MSEVKNEITERIISAAFTVSNELGSGFLEKVYQNAMEIELKEKGLSFESQKLFQVKYKGQMVGEYYPDLIVENHIILELKSIRQIDNIHKAQILNYLKAANLQFGLILNFGNPRVEIERFANGYDYWENQNESSTTDKRR